MKREPSFDGRAVEGAEIRYREFCGATDASGSITLFYDGKGSPVELQVFKKAFETVERRLSFNHRSERIELTPADYCPCSDTKDTGAPCMD